RPGGDVPTAHDFTEEAGLDKPLARYAREFGRADRCPSLCLQLLEGLKRVSQFLCRKRHAVRVPHFAYEVASFFAFGAASNFAFSVQVALVEGWTAKDYVAELGKTFAASATYGEKSEICAYCVTIAYPGVRKVDIAPLVLD
ncbi:MAG: hypothetical protein Q8Q79_10585, partial [Sphingopyxis sp.]|nr:hypothetical protein [Sphingopyxis sp.]